MLENALTIRNLSLKVKISIKTAVSIALIALAVGLPQLVHLFAGAGGGMRYLPMYLPVLLGGCILGVKWGLGIGVLSPLVSFLITSAAGNPMPAAARLPFMMAELAVFAAVSGAFSGGIYNNKWMAFPAVLLAAVSGRAVFIALVAIFQSVSPLTVEVVWEQIQTGFIGLIAQAVIVPFIVIGLTCLLKKDEPNE